MSLLALWILLVQVLGIRPQCSPAASCTSPLVFWLSCWGWSRSSAGVPRALLLLSARYESGDHVAVYPANDSSLVNQIGEILGTDLDTIMSLNNLDGEYG